MLGFVGFSFAKNMLAFAAMCQDHLRPVETARTLLLTFCISSANCFVKCHLFSECNKIKAEEDESYMRAGIKELFILQMSLIGIFLL